MKLQSCWTHGCWLWVVSRPRSSDDNRSFAGKTSAHTSGARPVLKGVAEYLYVVDKESPASGTTAKKIQMVHGISGLHLPGLIDDGLKI